MTKATIIQLIKDRCGLQFSDRTVAIHLGHVFTSVLGQLFAQNPNQWEFYSKRIKLSVSNRFAALTVPVIQTITNGNGVPRCYSADGDTVFYPSPYYSLTSSADAANLHGFVFYTVTANGIRFSDTLPEDTTEVLADAVLEISAYGDNDFINLPSGVAQTIIDLTVQAVNGGNAHGNIYKPKS